MQELIRKENLTEDEARRKLDAVEGPDRHPQLLFLAGRAWAGPNAMEEERISETSEDEEQRLEEVCNS
jgi:hypothetical protein